MEIDQKIVILVKKYFSLQNESQTATRSFPAVLKHFFEQDKNLAFRTKKCFSHENEQQTAKLSFSLVLKHFYGN